MHAEMMHWLKERKNGGPPFDGISLTQGEGKMVFNAPKEKKKEVAQNGGHMGDEKRDDDLEEDLTPWA